MRRIFMHIRNVGAQLLRFSGALRLIVDARLSDKCVVLTYHRVLDDSRARLANSSPGIVVSDSLFEMQMRVLRQQFNLISLSTFQSWLDNHVSLPPRSCLVTFDDGWLDNFEVAFPILKSYEIPACIFLPVRYISSTDMFWQEEMLMRLAAMASGTDGGSTERVNSLLGITGRARPATTEEMQQFVASLKSLEYSELEEVIQKIRVATDPHADIAHYNRYMSWEQIAEMKAAGIEFASHGMSHKILSEVPVSQCRDELVQSRQDLQRRLGEQTTAIAYPNGGYNDQVVEETRKAGYSAGFTTRPGFVTSRTDPFRIPRINVHSGSSGTEARFISTCARVL